MPRPTWTGTVSFGLVTVPVKMYTAARSKDIRFNMLHREDGARVRQKRVCDADGEELAQEDIVKGYEVSPGRYVMIEPEELEALEPTVSTGIEIKQFVDLEEIDPVYFENSYYLAPDKGAGKQYRLLLDAMRDMNKIAIATVVMRQKQYLTALRPAGNAISMATLYYPDEVVVQGEIDGIPEEDFKFDERGSPGAAAHRRVCLGFDPELPRRVPRAGAGPDRAEGVRRDGDDAGEGRAAGARGRPHGCARSLDRRCQVREGRRQEGGGGGGRG
jgi:DNA end-binding protein Ku